MKKCSERGKELVVAIGETRKEFVLIEESESQDIDMLTRTHQAGGQEGQAWENNPGSGSDIAKVLKRERGSCFQ